MLPAGSKGVAAALYLRARDRLDARMSIGLSCQRIGHHRGIMHCFMSDVIRQQ